MRAGAQWDAPRLVRRQKFGSTVTKGTFALIPPYVSQHHLVFVGIIVFTGIFSPEISEFFEKKEFIPETCESRFLNQARQQMNWRLTTGFQKFPENLASSYLFQQLLGKSCYIYIYILFIFSRKTRNKSEKKCPVNKTPWENNKFNLGNETWLIAAVEFTDWCNTRVANITHRSSVKYMTKKRAPGVYNRSFSWHAASSENGKYSLLQTPVYRT